MPKSRRLSSSSSDESVASEFAIDRRVKHHNPQSAIVVPKAHAPSYSDKDEGEEEEEGGEGAPVTEPVSPVPRHRTRSTAEVLGDGKTSHSLHDTTSEELNKDPGVAPVKEKKTSPRPRSSLATLIRALSPRARRPRAATTSDTNPAPTTNKEESVSPRRRANSAIGKKTTALTAVTQIVKLKRSGVKAPSSTTRQQRTGSAKNSDRHDSICSSVDAIQGTDEIDEGTRAQDESSHGANNAQSNDHDAAADLVADKCVDQLQATLCELLNQLDTIDPNKLGAIRLGGELRGLLGKAQDEFTAYESTFREHASHVGVSIALQNVAAALQQVFPIVARLHTAKPFLLNRNFKRSVLFAFQEINSYYTSLFMELAMAVASAGSSRAPPPLPSPIKTEGIAAQPVEDDPLPPRSPPLPPSPTVEDNVNPQLVLEKVPPNIPPTGDDICLDAHQSFFGHGRHRDLQHAANLYKQAATLGNAVAARCLGHMCMMGNGMERDLFLADQWLRQAAGNGDLEATYLLGCLLCDQAADCQDTVSAQRSERKALAVSQFTLAATNGHREAQYRLAQLLDDHGGRESEQWYRRAANQGHTQAEAALGARLYRDATGGDGGPKHLNEAIHFLQRAATREDPDALALLGVIHHRGNGVKKDTNRALAFLRRAIHVKPLAGTMYQLAMLLLASPHDTDDQEETHTEALRLLLNAAQDGMADALFHLGVLMDTSPFFRDRQAALRFYIKAASAKPPHAEAAKCAASMLYTGVGCRAVDKRSAYQYYSIAADAGHIDALNALGLMHEDGDGCDLDFALAAHCFRRAIELGPSAHAHFNLGCLLSQGKGVARNQVSAQAHFQKAVELGYALARDFCVSDDAPMIGHRPCHAHDTTNKVKDPLSS